jgi:hypothetical protein
VSFPQRLKLSLGCSEGKKSALFMTLLEKVRRTDFDVLQLCYKISGTNILPTINWVIISKFGEFSAEVETQSEVYRTSKKIFFQE